MGQHELGVNASTIHSDLICHVDLSRNPLSTLSGSEGSKLADCFPSLRSLCLAYARLREQPDLSGFVFLESVSLAHNALRELRSSRLPPSLRDLDVGDNHITELCVGGDEETKWREKSKLEFLNVERNHIRKLPVVLGFCLSHSLRQFLFAGNDELSSPPIEVTKSAEFTRRFLIGCSAIVERDREQRAALNFDSANEANATAAVPARLDISGFNLPFFPREIWELPYRSIVELDLSDNQLPLLPPAIGMLRLSCL